MALRISAVDWQRRQLLQVGGSLAVGFLLPPLAAQQQFSTLRIINANAAGGATDLLCRTVATALQSGYAGSVVVDNGPGGGGAVGAAYVKGLPRDGAAILQASMSTFTLAPFVQKNLPFDPSTDFTPLTVATAQDIVYAVGSMVPATVRTIPEYLEWTKRDPRNVTVASGGLVGVLIAAALADAARTRIEGVLYKGGNPAILDATAGHIPAVITSLAQALPLAQEGKLRLLALASDKRSSFAPSVPTFVELGVRDMVHKFLYPFFLPADTPAQLVASHSAAIRSALREPKVVEAMRASIQDILATDPKGAAELMAQDRAKWAALTARMGLKPE
jgi:tripartite-type tricarboxylate transporter receptor subunit TctC